MEELDNEWVNDFEKKEELYEHFYPKKVEKIRIYSLYVNENCVLDKVKEDTVESIQNNCFTKRELINLLREKKHDDGISYKLISILKYNVDLKPEEIKKYLYDYDKYGFIDSMKELKDIYFYETIPIFEDLNSIFLIYYEYKKKLKQNKTKKVYLTHQNTKRHRKTKRKQLKETTTS